MKLLTAVLLLAGCAQAQTATVAPSRFLSRAAGVTAGFCPACAPQINAGVWYANVVSNGDHPTYSFTLVNIDKAHVASTKPLNIQMLTSVETGVARHISKLGPFETYELVTAGVAADSTNVGASFSGGTLALAPLGKGFLLGAYVRIGKATISTDVAWKVGLTIGLASKD